MKERIRLIQEQLGLSQVEFANKLGISPASLSSIYTGRTNPTNNHVMAIHKAFPQINVSWLMFGEGEMCEAGSETGIEGNLSFADNGEDDGALEERKQNSSNTVGISLFPSVEDNLEETSKSWDAKGGVNHRESALNDRSIVGKTDNMNIIDKPERKIKEIRVFFSDGTYEAFVPSGK